MGFESTHPEYDAMTNDWRQQRDCAPGNSTSPPRPPK